MRNRKQFLSALTAGGAAVALAARRSVDAAPAAPVAPAAAASAPAAPPAASASPSQKPPSAAALAVAATMRRFDPKLSDAEVTRIARDIDDAGQSGAALNPKKKPLLNSDEPVTIFSVQP